MSRNALAFFIKNEGETKTKEKRLKQQRKFVPIVMDLVRKTKLAFRVFPEKIDTLIKK